MQVYTYPKSKDYTLYNTFEHPVIGLKMWGKSVQDGTPTPEAPAEIVSVGDDGNFKVTTCGKNLYENIIPVGYQSTINGITFTVNKDGTITANGTSTDSVIFSLKCTEVMDRFVGKDVILNGCPKGGGTWDTYYVQTYLSDYTGGIYDRGDGVLITNWEADRTIIRISIGANVTVNNLIFKPMIRLADITDDTYEPYMGSTAEITTGLPLCSVGDVRDELVYNADGTGKIIKRTAKLDSYNGEEITTDYISSTGGLDTDATVVYVLEAPQEINLSESEISALAELQTIDKITNVFNSDNAEMQITFLGGQEMETNIDGFWDSDDGDRKYSAADFVGFFQDFFTNGIVAESTTYLQVRAKSGFDIVVDVGKAYINGGFFKPKTVTTLTIPDSGTTYGRHDIVVLRWDKALKKIYLDVKSGTTTLTRNEIIYELGIAKIYVAANAVEITQADITDLRFDSAYCGIVTGVIDTIDTSNLFAQYEAAWNKFVDQLGDSDKVTIYSEDEQARSDINTIFQTLQRNAPYKTLSGKASSSSVTFSEPFAETPQVLAVLNTSTTTAYRTLTLFVSNISTTGFSVDRDAVTGATNASVDALSTGAYSWIALGK